MYPNVFKNINTSIEINDFENLFKEIKQIFFDFKPIFKELSSFKSLKQSNWNTKKSLYLQDVFDKLLEFINHDNKSKIDSLEHIPLKLTKKARSFTSNIELIENFTNKEFNVKRSKTENSLRTKDINSFFLNQQQPDILQNEQQDDIIAKIAFPLIIFNLSKKRCKCFTSFTNYFLIFN